MIYERERIPAVVSWEAWDESGVRRRCPASDRGHITRRESHQYAVPCHGCDLRARCSAESLACPAFAKFVWAARWTPDQRGSPTREQYAAIEREHVNNEEAA